MARGALHSAGSHLVRAGLCVLFMTAVAPEAAAEAPTLRRATVVARALSYERTLEGRVGRTVGFAVVFKPGAGDKCANDWMAAFGALSSVKIKDRPIFSVKVPYDLGKLKTSVDDGVDVFVVCDGLDGETDAIAQLARSRHVLTVGTIIPYVERNLTLGVAQEGDKTQIVINLKSADKEGVAFSVQLLKLARVIR
jgi:hypothetical protein